MFRGKILKLENKRLRSLETVWEQIIRAENVRGLSLSNNRLKGLPSDLSGLDYVENLDISGNMLREQDPQLILALRTLPRLRLGFWWLDCYLKREKFTFKILVSFFPFLELLLIVDFEILNHLRGSNLKKIIVFSL